MSTYDEGRFDNMAEAVPTKESKGAKMSDRKKYVFPTDEIPHLWAHSHELQGQARNPQNNLYFTGATLYSYRDTYPIARIVTNKRKEKCVLVNSDTYSLTTARHISMTYQAVSHLLTFTVPVVVPYSGVKSNRDIQENVKFYTKKVAKYEVMAMRARTNAIYVYGQLTELIQEANAYCKFFGVRKSFELTQPDKLKERVKEQTAKAHKEQAKKEEQRKRREAQQLLEAQVDIERWKNGELVHFPHWVRAVYLRVEGDEVVTSQGARIPITHARLGLAVVRKVKASGEAYQRNGHTLHLGNYAIDRIDTDGNLTAGCHFITYAEIERIAPMLFTVCIPVEDGSTAL